jgi:hypothetical protein
MPARLMLMSNSYFDHDPYQSANEIEPSHSPLTSQRRMDNVDRDFSTQYVLWGTIGSFVILSTIGVLIYAYLFNRKQKSFRGNLPEKIICSDCQYFNNNHFLKCALHPGTVLTEQAIDCRDYDQKIEIKQVKKWRRVLRAIHRGFS